MLFPLGAPCGRQRGLALVLCFLVLTLLSVVVLELVYSARVEMSLAQNFRDGLENDWAARSGVELARGMICASWAGFDSPREEWASGRSNLEVGQAKVSLRIRDEEGKFNLRLLCDPVEGNRAWAKEVLLRLLTIARENSKDEDEPSPQKLLETLVRWAEKGETGGPFKPGGGGLGEEGMDRRFLTLEELLFLDGFTPEILYGDRVSARDEAKGIDEEAAAAEELLSGALSPTSSEEEEEEEKPLPLAALLTVFGDGRVNINTAHVALLRALHPDMTAELAAALDEKRREPKTAAVEGEETAPPPPAEPEPQAGAAAAPSARDSMPGFRRTSEIREIEGIVDAGKAPPLDMHKDLAARIKVKSRFFTVRVLVKNERLTQRFEAVIQAGDQEERVPAATEEGGGEEEGGEEGGGEEGQDGTETPQEPGAQPVDPTQQDTGAEEIPSTAPRLSKVRILRMKALD